MRLSNIFLLLFLVIMLNGCFRYTSSYEVFEKFQNMYASTLSPDIWGEKNIYSEDRYMYTREFPKRCITGLFTNRDDKPEKVLGWVVVEGEKHCKVAEKTSWAYNEWFDNRHGYRR